LFSFAKKVSSILLYFFANFFVLNWAYAGADRHRQTLHFSVLIFSLLDGVLANYASREGIGFLFLIES